MNTALHRYLALALAGLMVAGTASSAFAFEPGQYHRDRFAHRHPRRAEVLHRDRRLSRELHEDKGHLGGNYNNLMAQDRSIRQQEQADARQNGGYITRGEKRQLNREENHLQHEIHHDDRGY